ncbi:MAG TPA: hypothetical protein VL307_04790, partial [Chitinophagaceae bacterium]|nr:hypothetical protein [Chitinophagaceae bacterium]
MILLCCMGLPRVAGAQSNFPQASISNGLVDINFYVPDTDKGYYRGTRFDWSGVMPRLTYKGHSYCAPWFTNYSPQLHEAVMGPVEGFSPLGYDSSKPAGRFVQIGVGVLQNNRTGAYTPFTYYPIVNAGEWKIEKSRRQISFTHLLHDTGYSYEYVKTEKLLKDTPVLVIEHRLKNTGRKPIVTDVYNHNLFVLDQQPTDAGAVISFPFVLAAPAEEQRNIGADKLVSVIDKQLVINGKFAPRTSAYTTLTGFGNTASDYAISIENH